MHINKICLVGPSVRIEGAAINVTNDVFLLKVVRTGERRDPDISEISRSHKALGRELEIPVVALSQLNPLLEIYFEVDITQPGMSNVMARF